jgi:hypothetical protein
MTTDAGSPLSKGLPELLKQVLSKLEQRDKVFSELVKTVVDQQEGLAKELSLLKAERTKDIPVIKVKLDDDGDVWDDVSGNSVVVKDEGQELMRVGPKSKEKEKEEQVVITVNVYKCGFCFFPWAFKTSDVSSS